MSLHETGKKVGEIYLEIKFENTSLLYRLKAAYTCLMGGTLICGGEDVKQALKRAWDNFSDGFTKLCSEKETEQIYMDPQKWFEQYFKNHIEHEYDCDIFNKYPMDWGNLYHIFHHAYRCGQQSTTKKDKL